MTKPERDRCVHCGAKSIRDRTGAGRTIPYRTMPAMELPADLPIPSCGRCKQIFLDRVDAAALSEVLQQHFLSSLRTRLRIAIDTLAQHISQRKLESLLGISQGYLCRLRAGVGNPSPELVSHLALLS